MQAIRMPRKSALAIAIATATAGTASQAAIEEVVVTAQKRAESVQDVPISVSAFDAAALDAQQIDTFSDLQFNVPNVSFSKGNFSGNNFQIRGIGTLLTATSGDSGVAQHVNDVYLQSPRLFETEYYDMEQVEILRGPQGTLFGRNSTGGAVNLKTAKPNFDGISGNVDIQAGNYDHGRVKGAFNLPVTENLAVRLAGIYLDRGGYSDNLATGNDVDDREQYSLRGSLRWYPSERTTVDIVASIFDEQSSRTRSQKQLCDQDPSGILGCLPTSLETGAVNGNATLGQLISSNLILDGLIPGASFSAYNAFAPPATGGNPGDLRDIAAGLDPSYEADETLITATVSHDVNDWLTATAIVGYQDTIVESRMDYNGTASAPGTVTMPADTCAVFPAVCDFFDTEPGGPLWISSVPDANVSIGAADGNFIQDSRGSGADVSLQESEQWSTEFRLSTNLDGPWNFLLSGYYLDFETETDYVVQAAGLDYANVILGSATALGRAAADPTFSFDPTTEFASTGLPYFNSETDFYGLESFAVFGEAYYDVTETVKITLGLRYSEDQKSLRDRQFPLLGLGNGFTVTGLDGASTYFGTDGSETAVTNLPQLIDAAVAAGDYDGDPDPAVAPASYRDVEDTFDAFTGRLVVDWPPAVPFRDETLVYAS